MEPHVVEDARAILSADGTRGIELRQVEAWRRMSSVDIAAAVNAAWAAGTQLAWYGMKDRFPSATDEELRQRIALQRLGPDLAVCIYPDAVALVDR